MLQNNFIYANYARFMKKFSNSCSIISFNKIPAHKTSVTVTILSFTMYFLSFNRESIGYYMKHTEKKNTLMRN